MLPTIAPTGVPLGFMDSTEVRLADGQVLDPNGVPLGSMLPPVMATRAPSMHHSPPQPLENTTMMPFKPVAIMMMPAVPPALVDLLPLRDVMMLKSQQ